MKAVLIVNPLSAAEYLSQELRGFDIYTVALYIGDQHAGNYTRPDSDWFDVQIHMDCFNLDLIIQSLKSYQIDFIINGSEFHTHYTDQIAERMLPNYANNAKTSHHRSNKFWMQEQLKQKGLPYLQQIKINRHCLSQDDLMKLKYPVFVKPTNGAASVGGFKAFSAQEIISRLSMQPENFLDNEFKEFVVQEFVDGQELVVDSFSVNGAHSIVGVYRYKKENFKNNPLYRYCEVVMDAKLIDDACRFVRSVLTACGMNHGFAHTEIFLTAKGFYLVEINPRFNGAKGATNKIAKLAGLTSQDQIFAKWYKSKILLLENPEPRKYARWIALYGQQKDFLHLHGYAETIQISEAKNVHQKSNISFLDVHQLVLIAAKHEAEINDATCALVSADII